MESENVARLSGDSFYTPVAERLTACFYCQALVARNNLEMDHFPIPESAGGQVTVPACRGCHDMKDRFNIEDWPAGWLAKVMLDFPRLSRETKIFLAKALGMFPSRP